MADLGEAAEDEAEETAPGPTKTRARKSEGERRSGRGPPKKTATEENRGRRPRTATPRILERRGQGGLECRAGRAAPGAEEVRAAAGRVRQREGARGRRDPRPAAARSSAPTPSSTRPLAGGADRAGAAARLRRQMVPGRLEGACREESRRMGQAQPEPPGRAALLAEANRRGQEDIKVATQRAEQAFEHAKRAEHAKLAHKLPDYFGSPRRPREDLRRARQVPVRQGHPGRPHQPDP